MSSARASGRGGIRRGRRMRGKSRPGSARRSRKRPVSIEDLHTLRFLHAGSLSADGSRYVFSARIAREDRKGYDSHLYLVKTAEGSTRQLTHGKKSDGGPVISPDGAWIAFVSKRGERPGIHVMPSDGGEARPLAEKEGEFTDLSFSPDSRKILCVFRPSDPPEGVAGKASADRERGNAKRATEKSDDAGKAPAQREAPVYRHIDRLFYRLDGMGFLPKEEPQLWLFDMETGEGKQLTHGRRGAYQPSFSPDGRRIAFMRNIRPDPDVNNHWLDLFVIPASGGRPRRIPTPPGPAWLPVFSPDGKMIAYLGHDDLDDPFYEKPRVWVVPASGRGRARCLCPRFDQPAYDGTIGDMGGEFGWVRPHWSPNGRTIFFASCAWGSAGLYKVPVRGGIPVQLTPDRIHLRPPALSRDCRIAVGVVATPTMPPDVFAYDLRTGEGRRLTTLNEAWADARDLRRPQHVRFKSTENTTVEGWILKPPNFSPRRRYPAIVEIHGGPQAQYGYTFFHELQVLAAQGYVVFYSNPRGSLGYGRAFAEAIKHDWGNRDYADVMAGTDYLARLPYVNEKRLGITGGSYGGYMTNWVVGHTQRFKAAVTQRAVVDMVPFFGSSDIGYSFYRTMGDYPWADRERYEHQSPLTYAKKIRTPLLIIHSENDLRCSIEQAENLFATLKMLKRRVEFIRFPEEPHGLSRQGRPDRRQVRLEKIVEWFRRYL